MAIAINSKLKKSIVVKSAKEVSENFHARYNCTGKTYKYVINNSKNGSALYRTLEYHIPVKLDVDSMKKAIKFFEGEHDFKGFKATGGNNKSTVRTIYKAEILEENGRIILNLTGNSFMYNMVRIIAGTLVDVGLGKIKPEEIQNIIKLQNRELAGKTLPPHGLYLVEVYYE